MRPALWSAPDRTGDQQGDDQRDDGHFSPSSQAITVDAIVISVSRTSRTVRQNVEQQPPNKQPRTSQLRDATSIKVVPPVLTMRDDRA
jgi:hypothetical protein